jgi:hypothetical protein
VGSRITTATKKLDFHKPKPIHPSFDPKHQEENFDDLESRLLSQLALKVKDKGVI